MVIKRSSAREVAGLLRDLEQGTGTERQAAVARLAVIGTRAVDGVLAVLSATGLPAVRTAALGVLEAIGDARALDHAFAWLEQGDPEVSASAAAVLERFLDSEHGTAVLDRLTLIALDNTRLDQPRVAAVGVLRKVPEAVTAPLWARLRSDPSETIKGAVGAAPPSSAKSRPDPDAALQAAAAGNLPDDPDELRRALNVAAAAAPLPTLHRVVEVIRERERRVDEADRAAWMTVRAAVHLALAERGSTVALYDLRETIERGEPAPVEMLAALDLVGDRSCLEPIAAACARLTASGPGAGPDDPWRWWREHLVTTFQAIARRERVGERHAEARRIRARWPEAAIALLGPRGQVLK